MFVTNDNVKPYMGGRIEVRDVNDENRYGGLITSLKVEGTATERDLVVNFQEHGPGTIEGAQMSCCIRLPLRALEATIDDSDQQMVLRHASSTDDIYLSLPA